MVLATQLVLGMVVCWPNQCGLEEASQDRGLKDLPKITEVAASLDLGLGVNSLPVLSPKVLVTLSAFGRLATILSGKSS